MYLPFLRVYHHANVFGNDISNALKKNDNTADLKTKEIDDSFID